MKFESFSPQSKKPTPESTLGNDRKSPEHLRLADAIMRRLEHTPDTINVLADEGAARALKSLEDSTR